jgi:uncharacterized surface protein with fasciclin (FAS1) repeats
MKGNKKILGYIFTASIFWACTQPPEHYSRRENTRQIITVENIGDAHLDPSRSVIENLAGSNNHTTFVSLIKAAGMAETLSGPGPITVLAPNEKAFASLSKEKLNELIQGKQKELLIQLIARHILPDSIGINRLGSLGHVKTIRDEKLQIKIVNEKCFVNNA